MKYFSTVALLVSALVSGVVSFSPLVRPVKSSALYYFPDNFERAVECATYTGECDISELERLADGKELIRR